MTKFEGINSLNVEENQRSPGNTQYDVNCQYSSDPKTSKAKPK